MDKEKGLLNGKVSLWFSPQEKVICMYCRCELSLGLGDIDKIEYPNIFLPRYRNNIVVLTIGALTKHLHNVIFDK